MYTHVQSFIITLAVLFTHSYSDFVPQSREAHPWLSWFQLSGKQPWLQHQLRKEEQETHLPVPNTQPDWSVIIFQLVANRPQMSITHPPHLHHIISPLISIALLSFSSFLQTSYPLLQLICTDHYVLQDIQYIDNNHPFQNNHPNTSVVKKHHVHVWGLWMIIAVTIFWSILPCMCISVCVRLNACVCGSVSTSLSHWWDRLGEAKAPIQRLI